MDLLTPVVTGILLAVFGVLTAWINKGRFDSLERQIDRVADQVGRLAGEMTTIRSDITHLALELGSRTRPDAG